MEDMSKSFYTDKKLTFSLYKTLGWSITNGLWSVKRLRSVLWIWHTWDKTQEGIKCLLPVESEWLDSPRFKYDNQERTLEFWCLRFLWGLYYISMTDWLHGGSQPPLPSNSGMTQVPTLSHMVGFLVWPVTTLNKSLLERLPPRWGGQRTDFF
jgi:hypothetical protein